MKISIVLPVYNAASTIEDALESILLQTYKDFELIIVDDGSTDFSLQIIEKAADPRIRVIKTVHGGIVSALTTALDAATGEFIARMDADDVAHPSRLEKQLHLIESDPQLGAVGCHVKLFTGEKEQLNDGMKHYVNWLNSLTTPEEIAKSILIEMPMLHPTLLIRSAALKQVGGYKLGEFPEDYDLFLRLYKAGWKFAKVPEMLFAWRDHAHKLSRNSHRYSAKAFRLLKVKSVIDLFLKKNPNYLFWGVGHDGKQFVQDLSYRGFTPTAFIDIDKKKIGNQYLNRQIIDPTNIPPAARQIFCCVGTKGARAEIRKFLTKHGHEEGRNFWFLA